MMMLFRLLLILSLSAVAPLNPNVNKEATEEDLVTDDISGVNGDGVVSDGIDNHTFENTNRDAKHIFYGGNIKFSGTIDSTGNHAHINIGSISNNAAVQDHHHEPDASQEVKPEPKPIDLDNSSRCSFNGALLSAPVLVKGEMSPHDTRLSFLWEKNIIPYYYSDQNTKVADKNLIRSVMNTIESETCFKFQEETKEDYEEKHSLEINIMPELCSGGVIGSVDTVPGHLRLLFNLTAQVTELNGEDCGKKSLILHELMHVLGVGHTQRRSDRDDFITVNWENLGTDEEVKDQYRKCENCTVHDGIPYDCDSIMHYGTHYDGKVVIEAKKDTCKLEKYGGKEASSTDWKLLRIIGNCTVCTADQFSCLSGQQCINMHFKCDGEKECADGSDEVNCEKTDSVTEEADCSCNGYLDEYGEGECNDDWPYGSKQFWCYVKEGSCSDAEEFEGNFWSYKACDVGKGYEKLWRDDGRCGKDYPLDNGEKGQCDPYGISPCCSRWGWCGNTPDHCDCMECVNYAYAVCAADQFACSSGDCIKQEKRCDGVLDCQDQSDESKCIVSGEGVDIEFRAEEGEDHPSKRMGVYLKTDQEIRGRPVYEQKEQKLDEQQFLFFGLDEHWRVGPNKEKADEIGLKNEWKDEKMINETTPPKNGWQYWNVQKGEWISDPYIQIREVCADDQFSCVSGECIYPEMRCDGEKDCLDGSDEEIGDCQLIACTGNHIFCSGKCIKENKLCNGFWDCANGEDEIYCPEQDSVQWSGMQTKIWGDDQCKNTGNFGNLNFGLEDCKKKCLEIGTCTAINYDKVNMDCVTRRCTQPVPAPQWQHGDYRGYYIKVCMKEDNYDYWGNDIENKQTTDQEDCANWCGAHKECKAWTLRKNDNWCWIKTSDAGRSKNNLFISGTKGCGGYEKLWTDNGKCGKDNPLPNGKPGQCDPIHGSPCCSSLGYCGNSDDHCKCPTCVNYKEVDSYKYNYDDYGDYKDSYEYYGDYNDIYEYYGDYVEDYYAVPGSDGSKPEDEGEEEEEEEEDDDDDDDDLGCSFNDDILANKVLPSGQMSPHSGKERFQWDNNIINYYFKPNTRIPDKKLVQKVMKRIKEKTCFEFVEQDDSLEIWDTKHCLEIRISKEKGCKDVSGDVDIKKDKDGLVLIFTGKLTDRNGKDCVNKGLILHELMHVLGVAHTQRRSDRDYSITVYDKRLKNEGLAIEKQYKVCGKCELYPSIGYDCDSIMHYGTHYNQKKIMEPKYENCTLSIRHKMFLEEYQYGTDKDWELLNIIGKVRCPRN